jgi:hypothetical protein
MTSAQFPEALAQAVSQGTLDARCMHVENIRHAFDLTTPEVQHLCQEAEAQGVLGKTLQYLCPNEGCGRAIESSPSPLPADQDLTCDVCECMERTSIFEAGNLTVLPVYSLVEHPAKSA